MSVSIQKRSLVKFAPRTPSSFYETLKSDVNAYFESKKISERANATMYVKTVAMISLYFVPYLVMVTGLASGSLWLWYGLWLLMGAGIVGIGASVMHDSNHGSYTRHKWINNSLGNLLNILGGYSVNWKIQHNILHHTYTNLDGLDEDIDAGIMLRMSPHKPHYRFHRYQHIYAWGLYCLMNLFWITVKDYRLIFRYHRQDLLRKQKTTLRKALWELSGLKVLYIAYMIVLPLLFSGLPWYHVLLGFVAMHMLAGLALACVFQPAHVMEESAYGEPDEQRRIDSNWAVHQVVNTTNFAPRSAFITWFIGGLNYQIEHHLFPHICHVHYPALSRIVQRVAQQYNIPYQVQPTFAHALWKHGQMLKKLGQKA